MKTNKKMIIASLTAFYITSFAIISLPLNLVSAQNYQQIAQFTGASSTTTDYFTTTSTEWKIDWSYTTTSSYPAFFAFVYPKGETVVYTTSIESGGQPSGTTYVHLQTGGTFYVRTLAANLQGWTITISGQPTPSPSPTPTATPTPSPTPTLTPSPTPTLIPSPTPTPTPTHTTASPTPTQTTTPSPSPTIPELSLFAVASLLVAVLVSATMLKRKRLR